MTNILEEYHETKDNANMSYWGAVHVGAGDSRSAGMTPSEALDALKAGNLRYQQNECTFRNLDADRREETA